MKSFSIKSNLDGMQQNYLYNTVLTTFLVGRLGKKYWENVSSRFLLIYKSEHNSAVSLWDGSKLFYDSKLLITNIVGGPRVVVSTVAFHARVRGSVPSLSGLKETKNVSYPSTCESQYCEELPWPRGSVLGLRPPGLEFRILCLEDSVISIISSSSGGSPGPV